MNNFEAHARDYLENHKDKIDPEVHFMPVVLPTSEVLKKQQRAWQLTELFTME